MDDFMKMIANATERASTQWTISGFSEMTMPDGGVAYQGALARDFSQVASFYNRGDGGATFINFTDREARDAFEAEAAELFPGEPEAADHLILALLERFAADA